MKIAPQIFKKSKINWKSFWFYIPGILFSLLPKCPICLPAFMWVLSSLGIGATAYKANLFPLTIIFLFIALVFLSHRAAKHKRYTHLLLGVTAAACIIFGKFFLYSYLLLCGGVLLLIAASFGVSISKKPTLEKGDKSKLSNKEFQDVLNKVMNNYLSKKVE